MNNNWIYFGVFLDGMAKAKNIHALEMNGVKVPESWKWFNHHMTIAFNNGSEEAQKLYHYYEYYLDEVEGDTEFTITVDGIGVSDEAIAMRVRYDIPIANKVPHITIATPQKGKPVNSNNITNWVDIEPYSITGVLKSHKK